MGLSQEEIKEIAAEVVKQLLPALVGRRQVEVKPETPVDVEIAMVRAAGLDLFTYLKQKSKVTCKVTK